MDDFTLTLNLAQCDNTGFNHTYRYILPNTISLDPNAGYQVRLEGISVSDEIINTRNCSLSFTRIEPPTDVLIKTMPVRAVYRPSRFLKLINGLFEADDVKEYFGLPIVGPAPLQYTITEDTGVAVLKMKAPFDLDNYRIDFNHNLASKLGYDRTRITELPYESPHLMNINSNQEYLVVLGDVVKSSLYNKEYIPLLHSCPFDIATKTSSPNESAYPSSVRKKEYTSSIFRPINNFFLAAIDFRLMHETMDDIEFSTLTTPNILIKLHFRRCFLSIH